jgi:hypothetical protein
VNVQAGSFLLMTLTVQYFRLENLWCWPVLQLSGISRLQKSANVTQHHPRDMWHAVGACAPGWLLAQGCVQRGVCPFWHVCPQGCMAFQGSAFIAGAMVGLIFFHRLERFWSVGCSSDIMCSRSGPTFTIALWDVLSGLTQLTT